MIVDAIKHLITDLKIMLKVSPWSLFCCPYKDKLRNIASMGHFIQTPVNNLLKTINTVITLSSCCSSAGSKTESQSIVQNWDAMWMFLIVHTANTKTHWISQFNIFAAFLWGLQNSMTIYDLSSLVLQHAAFCRGQKMCLQQYLSSTGKRIHLVYLL